MIELGAIVVDTLKQYDGINIHNVKWIIGMQCGLLRLIIGHLSLKRAEHTSKTLITQAFSTKWCYKDDQIG